MNSAPTPTPQGTPPPPRIWLQWEGDQEPDNYAEHEGVTWAATQIWKHDVEYVRASELSTAQARASAAETALARAEEMNVRAGMAMKAACLSSNTPPTASAVLMSEQGHHIADMENQQLREALSTAMREIDRQREARREEESWWKEKHDYQARSEKAESALATTQAELREARERVTLLEGDAKRMDWLSREIKDRYTFLRHSDYAAGIKVYSYFAVSSPEKIPQHMTLREAVDAAIRAAARPDAATNSDTPPSS